MSGRASTARTIHWAARCTRTCSSSSRRTRDARKRRSLRGPPFFCRVTGAGRYWDVATLRVATLACLATLALGCASAPWRRDRAAVTIDELLAGAPLGVERESPALVAEE